MNERTLISIIVPVFNGEIYISNCIENILAQSYQSFELIIINDGSTDRTLEICNTYSLNDDRIKIFHTKNNGPSSARNVGLKEARGRWIAFADSDDYVDKDWLLDFVQAIGVSPLIVQGYYENKLGFQNPIKNVLVDDQNIMSTSQFIQAAVKSRALGYLWCKFFNAEIIRINEIEFNVNYRIQEDENFVLQYLEYIDNVQVLSSAHYYYQRPDYNKKYKNDINCIKANWELIKKIFIDGIPWLLPQLYSNNFIGAFFQKMMNSNDRDELLRLLMYYKSNFEYSQSKTGSWTRKIFDLFYFRNNLPISLTLYRIINKFILNRK